MPEIIRITSEALQAQIRRLLPSQTGFGDDLQATNLVTPIIDLTPTAEGSNVPTYLQTALAFGSQTAFDVSNGSSTLVTTAGFWRIIGTSAVRQDASSLVGTEIRINDGLGNKSVWKHDVGAGGQGGNNSVIFDFTLFLRPGDSLNVNSNYTYAVIAGSVRQVADVTGNLINPVGFSIE